MNVRVPRIKKKGLLFLAIPAAGLLAFFVLGYALLDDGPGDSNSICRSPAYRSVRNGMSKPEIVSLLGQPELKRVKNSASQDFFSQGEHEAKIREGWIYGRKGHATAAEIYFGSTGQVNGKNCGQG